MGSHKTLIGLIGVKSINLYIGDIIVDAADVMSSC